MIVQGKPYVPTLGSRGHFALGIALAQPRNKNTKQKEPIDLGVPTVVATTAPTAQVLSRSRSKVLFKEPVVSQKYIYEPTIVPESIIPNRLDSTDIEKRLAFRKRTKKRYNLKRSLLNEMTSIDTARYTQLDTSVQEISDSNTDEDEEFFLAPTSFMDPQPPPSPARKRSFNELETDNTGDQVEKSEPSSEESLFSSPKIAKVAPYYRDDGEPQQPSTDLKSACANRARFLDFFYCLLRVK